MVQVGTGQSETIAGPAVAVIGCFPRLPPDPAQLPPGYSGWAQSHPLLRFWPPRTIAMCELFASGNDVPPNPLGGYGGFQGVVLSQEFRVAVCIRNVSVTWDDRAGTVDFRRQTDVVEGYTPVNRWRFQPPNWQHTNHGYHRGSKKFLPDVVTANSVSAMLTVTAKVKLWWVYNILSSAAIFHLAPWAIVVVKYTVYRAGHTQIEFAGSSIPSQFNYVNWVLHSDHDMAGSGVADVSKFLSGGHCRDAPVRIVSSYPP